MDPLRNPSIGLTSTSTPTAGSVLGLNPAIGWFPTLSLLAVSLTGLLLSIYAFTGTSSTTVFSVSLISLIIGLLFLLWRQISSIFSFFTPSKVSLGADGEFRKTIGIVVFLLALGFVLVFIPAYLQGGVDVTAAAVGGFFGILGLLMIIGFVSSKADQNKTAAVIKRISFILYYFLPYALFSFGPIVDIITNKLQFTVGSMVGVSSIFLNWIAATLFNGGVPPTADPSKIGCEVPGLAGFSSNLIPQTMMANLSMFAYIATYISRSTLSGPAATPTISFANPASTVWPVWVAYLALAGISTVTFSYTGCLKVLQIPQALIAPTLYGGLFGLLASEVLGPRYAPGGAGANASQGLLGGTPTTTPTVGTCAAGSSDGEFICESFENGKLKIEKLTE